MSIVYRGVRHSVRTACCGLLFLFWATVAQSAASLLKPDPQTPVQSPVLIAPVPQMPPSSNQPSSALEHNSNQRLKVTEEQLLARPALLQRAMLSVIQDENLPAVRVLLPIYLKWKHHDTSIALYAQSLLDLNDGYIEAAHKGFAALQHQFPQAVPIQYHNAQTLFLLGYYTEAQTQLEEILHNYPGDFSRSRVNPYLTYIRRMTQGQFSFSANAYYDPNINNAPDKGHLGDCQRSCVVFESPKKSWVLDLNGQWQKQWFLPHRLFTTIGYQWYNSWALNASEYSFVQLKIYQNIGMATPRSRIYLQPFMMEIVRDNKAYSMSYGVEMAWQQAFSRSFGTQLNQVIQYDRYWVQTFRNSLLYTLTFSQNWVASNARSFFFTQSSSVRVGTRSPSDSYWSYSLGVSWVEALPWQIQSRLSAHYSQVHFMGPHLLAPTEDRLDRDYGVQLSLQYLPLHVFGLVPTLNFVWKRHHSNAALYNYSSRNINISLSWRF